MSGTLSSLNTALSALKFNRVALDVAGNNIANATTEGYTRRRVVGETVGGTNVPGLWSRTDGVSGSVGAGVGVRSIDRLTDTLLDARARGEHGNQSYLDVHTASLQRVESGIGEPGDSGVAAALTDFRTSWSDLSHALDAGSNEVSRGQVLSKASALVDAVHAQASQVAAEQGNQRARAVDLVSQINTTASELAATNTALNRAALGGVDTNDLADQRDVLALRLADLTGATATSRPDGGLDISVGGVSLVSGSVAGTLKITGGIDAQGGDDGNPLTFGISLSGVDKPISGGFTGTLGGTADLLTTTLPAYAAGLSAVVVTLADQVNTVHKAGYDATGAPGGDFFSYDPTNPAASLSVKVTSTAAIAASGVAGGGVGTSNAEALATSGAPESAYQRLVTGFGTQVASADRLGTTQRLLTSQVDSAREQLSGVSTDEEMVSMVTAQHAYEAAARLMTTVDSMLDTLINRTGLLN